MTNRVGKKTITQKAAKEKSDPLTVQDIDRMLAESVDVWRKRLPLERKRGVPVKPGAARLFVHSF